MEERGLLLGFFSLVTDVEAALVGYTRQKIIELVFPHIACNRKLY